MTSPAPTPFDISRATEQEWQALNQHMNRMQSETLPDDPPLSLEVTIRAWRGLPVFLERQGWMIWAGDTLAALGYVDLLLNGTNQHMAQTFISVLPEYRRQGLGRQLLTTAAHHSQSRGRRLMMSFTDSQIPAGAAFAEWVGATVGFTAHLNQLDLRELNRELLHTWQARAAERAPDFVLDSWESPLPQEALPALATLKQAMNQAPQGDLEVEDVQWTPEMVQQMYESRAQQGIKVWIMYAREQRTGNVAGYTELLWRDNVVEIIHQGDTGVLEQYRNLGLGRWLKAAMLEKLLREHPESRFIRSGNADANAPMLKINHELGFKPYRAATIWQLTIENALTHLE